MLRDQDDGSTHAPTSRTVSIATLPITLLIQAAVSAAVIAPTVAAPVLLEALDVGPAVVGIYMATVYLGAAVSSQWSAVLVRRLGPIRSSQIGLALCALGLLLVAEPNVFLGLGGALVLGFGYGPITPASSEMLIRTANPARVALVFSIKQTGVPVGGIVAGFAVPPVLLSAGSGWALGQIGALCVLAILLSQALRRPLDSLRDRSEPLPTLATMVRPMQLVWANLTLRRLALCTLVFSTVQVSLTSFAVSFLNVDLAWNLVAAGAALSMSQAAGAVGRILWGAVADRWHAPRQTLLGLALVMALVGLVMPLAHAQTSPGVVFLLLIVYGGTAVGWNGVYLATVAQLVPREQAAIATGGSLFFTYLGVVVGAPLFGVVCGALGSIGLGFAVLALPLAWSVWALASQRWESAQFV